MHFSEIIKLQFGKKRHTLLCILLFFRIILLPDYLKKMHGFLQFSFWLPGALVKFCFLRIILNRVKTSMF